LISHAGVESTLTNGEVPAPQSDFGSEASIAASAAIYREINKETILLVEDEVFVRKAAGAALESAGYRVLTAGNGAQALQACGQLPTVDLLLADLVMPGISGQDLAKQFTILCPRVPILLMSGYAEQLALCGLSSYCWEYMAKPFSVQVLLRRVREVLAGESSRS
jgi:two-component system, cell cycle sensor histidine kinase and response regulator CckA